MRIKNFLSLIHGELRNEPSIANITLASIDSARAKSGGVHFALDSSDIKKALCAGVYAIVAEEIDEILDSEIAWIEVKDIHKAIIAYMRYLLIEFNVNLISLTSAQFDIALGCVDKRNTLLIDNDLRAIANQLFTNLSSYDTIIFNREGLYQEFGIDIKSESGEEEITLTNHSLFDINFIYKSHYFHKIKVAPLYLDAFKNLLFVLNRHQIAYTIERIKYSPALHPIYLNAKNEQVKAHHSHKVLIFNARGSEEIREYLKQKATWTTLSFIDAKQEDVYAYIQKRNFRTLCLENININRFEFDKIAKKVEQQTLLF